MFSDIAIVQVLGLNPQLRSMLDSNSQLREMMQNPEFLRQLISPETMQVIYPVCSLYPLFRMHENIEKCVSICQQVVLHAKVYLNYLVVVVALPDLILLFDHKYLFTFKCSV